MPKVTITHGFEQYERKQFAAKWLTDEDGNPIDNRRSTPELTQVAVWLREGFDVLLSTNVFDGFEIEIQEKEEVND